MIVSRPFIRSVAAVALLCNAAISQAAINSFTSLSAFQGTDPVLVDGFGELTIDPGAALPLGTQLTRTAGGFSYTVATANNLYVVTPTGGNKTLSVEEAGDRLVFSNFTLNGSSPLLGFGANLFATLPDNTAPSSGSNAAIQAATAITVIATEIGGATSTVLLTGANPLTRFAGFRSSQGLTSVEAYMTTPLSDGITPLFVTVDNVTAVPEPSTLMLWLVAGLAIPLLRRRG